LSLTCASSYDRSVLDANAAARVRRELRGPFPEMECAATGAIDAANARTFVEAGCVAVGVGGAIARAEQAERRALVATAWGLV
jgi:2-keto-3-deoxy-6-phosphogluconate aldolase